LQGMEFACAAGDEHSARAGVDALGDVLGELGQVDLTRLGERGDGKEQYAVKHVVELLAGWGWLQVPGGGWRQSPGGGRVSISAELAINAPPQPVGITVGNCTGQQRLRHVLVCHRSKEPFD